MQVTKTKRAFYASDVFASKDYVIISNGTPAGTNEILLETPYPSNFFVQSNRVYFAEGVDNGFSPILYYANLYDNKIYTIKSFNYYFCIF